MHLRIFGFIAFLFITQTYCESAFDFQGKYYFDDKDSGTYSITYDPISDRAWVVGTSNGTIDGTSPVGKADGFYMEVSTSDLKVKWFYFIGTEEDDYILDSTLVYVNGTPILYLVGKSQGDFQNLTNYGLSNDAFITAINLSNPAVPLWTNLEGGVGDQIAYSVSVDLQGNIYMVGETDAGFDGELSFGGKDGFIIKYNSTGGKEWLVIEGSPNDDTFRGSTTSPADEDAGIFVVGAAAGNFAGNTNGGANDIVVAQYSPDSTRLWCKLLGNSSNDFGWGLEMDKTGFHLFLVGALSFDALTASLNFSTGEPIWMRIVGSPSFGEANFGIAISESTKRICAGGDTKSNSVSTITCYDYSGTFVLNTTLGSSDGLNHVAAMSGDLWNGTLFVGGVSTGVFYGNTPTAFNNAFMLKVTLSEDKASSSDHTVELAAGIIASIASILGLLFCGGIGGGLAAVWYIKRKNRKRMEVEVALEHATPSKASRNNAISAEHSKYIIAYTELKIQDELGSGNFGVVNKGYWRSQTVAIKQIKTEFDDDGKQLQDFLNEAMVMMSMKPHKNITTLYAVCLSPLLIVTEFVENGSLDKFLHKTNVSFGQIIQILKDITAGMHHLAAEGIVHKDLAARNVLISKDGTAKIADFGLAKTYDEKSSEKEKGPTRWMSPEALSRREFSEKSDVWSFAATTVEIVTGTFPYPHLTAPTVAKRVIAGELRPELPSSIQLREGAVEIPDDLSALIRRCTEFDPDKRPTFEKITMILSEISPESHPLSISQLPVHPEQPSNTSSEYNNVAQQQVSPTQSRGPAQPQSDTYNTGPAQYNTTGSQYATHYNEVL